MEDTNKEKAVELSDSQELRFVERQCKYPAACPIDPAELTQCDSCQ